MGHALDLDEPARLDREGALHLVILRVPRALAENADVPYRTMPLGMVLTGAAQGLGNNPNALQLIIFLNPNVDPNNLIVGEDILLPNPDMPLPTATPIPADLPRGTKIVYTIESGDSLELIASKFNSTVEAILALKENVEAGITDANTIFAGQKIVVPVNLVTPTPTPRPSVTPVFTTTP